MNLETIKFLNQLKNASLGNLEKIKTRSNNLILNLLKVLYKEGYILSFRRILKEDYLNETSEFLIHIKNPNGKQLFKDLKIISTPSNQKYFSLKDINRMESKRKLIIFSTDKGILTLTECKRNYVGGILLFIC
jgi:small subunit ribosomal protein S8